MRHRVKSSAVFLLFEMHGCTVSTLAENNPKPPKYEYSGNSVGVLDPPYLSARVNAQASRFTVHKDPTSAMLPHAVIEIPCDSRARIAAELNDFGIADYAIYPDLDGIVKHLQWEFRQWGSALVPPDKSDV